MKTKPFAVVLVVLCTVLTAIGGLLFKLSMTNFKFTIWGAITNYVLILGLFSYGVGLLILIYALKNGELSVLFPIASLTYVWGLLLSVIVLHETVSYPEVFGVMLLLGGVSAIGKGSTVKHKIRLGGKK